MIHLISVTHDHQFIGLNTKEPGERLKAFLKDYLEENDVAVLAEEYNASFRGIGTVELICEVVAREAGIVHIYADYSEEERNELGIEIGDHEKREAHWYEMIVGHIDEGDMIFVLGADHTGGFKALLEGNGHEVQELTTMVTPSE